MRAGPASRALRIGVVLALLGATRSAQAGPYFSFKRKALSAIQIAEVEIAVVEPSRKALLRDRRRLPPPLPTRIVRFLLEVENGSRVPSMEPRNMLPIPSGCWELARKAGSLRMLVFWDYGGVGEISGLESGNGGFTSVNPDYSVIVDAVSIVSEWRSRRAPDKAWKREIEFVTSTSNPYLKYLGAVFLADQSPEIAQTVARMTRAPSDDVYSPAAPCGGPRSPVLRLNEP